MDQIKKKSAEVIDLCEEMRNQKTEGLITGEKQRIISISQTQIELGCMAAVRSFYT